MLQGIPSNVNSYSADQDILFFHGTWRFITVLTKTCHETLSWPCQSIPHIYTLFL